MIPYSDQPKEYFDSHATYFFFNRVCVSADVISTVEFNQTGEFLATGDKGGRVVIFQREPQVKDISGKHTFPFLTNFLLKVEVGMGDFEA